LVLSTLHTNDVISTLDRLIDMKVPVYLIASLLEGILSQRLVRLLCPKCKKPHLSSPRETAALKLKEPSLLYEPVGCPACHQSGYIGRRGIFEVLKLTDPLRDIIRPDNRQEIHHLWGQHFTPFSAGIRTLIMKGVTSYNEGIRIISL
jgi:type II secretory ATPase GspE/PulE/Tfp pilus assembly ATPase PilB-like protein